MRDTPRTDAVCTEIGKLGYSLRLGHITLPKFAKLAQEQLDKCGNVERELNAANERIKRLEEAGNMMKNDLLNHYRETGSINSWNAATESKP